METKSFARPGGKPGTGTRLLEELEVSPRRLAISRYNELGQPSSVKRGGEVLLAGRV